MSMITTIQESGFCHGVKSAVKTTDANFFKIEKGQKVYLYGDLVNNSHVMSKYHSKGFLVANTPEEIEPNSTVIIRAHGVPKAVYQSLNEKNVFIEDCTCAKIKITHKIVENEDKTVVIIGEKKHPEVVGIHGWCKNNRTIILETEADLQNVDWSAPMCIVGQTTCKRDWWHKATSFIQQKQPDVLIHQTLCNATTKRAESAAKLANQAKAMIVVGDEKSANSLELYNTCLKICPLTFFVSSLEDLLRQDIVKKVLLPNANIGLVGSASAPAEVVNKIHEYLVFTTFFSDTKLEINNYAKYIFQNLHTNIPFVSKAIQELEEQDRGGKRLRGALIKLGEKIASGETAGYLHVATAYELFQTAILIHDDIIDKSKTRRGKKTIHTTYEDEHFGISRALCAGDYGLFYANYMLANAPPPLNDAVKIKIQKQFSEVQLRTLEGEIMDVTLPFEPIDPEENYDNYMNAVSDIYRYKTAWYTLAGPLMIGAICGGANDKLVQELKKIATPLGVAFQIKDDLLGMYAKEEVLGKPAISDMEEKKQTMLYGYAYKHATTQQKAKLNKLYGKQDATQADLETVRDIFTATGALQFSQEKINDLSQESLALIEKSKITDDCKALLRGLVSYLIVREF